MMDERAFVTKGTGCCLRPLMILCNVLGFYFLGIAYLNGVCRDNRVSINEEMGFFQGAGVLAHELGHK